jgi:hypothetical protein
MGAVIEIGGCILRGEWLKGNERFEMHTRKEIIGRYSENRMNVLKMGQGY